MSDLISVIVPVYNIENKLLDKCINSIINQTYKNLEIIIVDDGSKQECADECDRLSQTDSRIRLIHQKNKGVSGARNAGLDIAKGEYIGFVDPDDYLDEDMYEILYEGIKNSNKDISMVAYRVVYPDGTVKNRDFFESDVLLSKEEALSYLFDDKLITSTVMNKLYSKNIWLDNRFLDGKIHEDCRIMHKLIYDTKDGIAVINKTCYNYYQRADSIMNAKSLDKSLEEIEAWEERLAFVEEHFPEQAYKIKMKLIKLSIKDMLNYRFQLGISKDDYKTKTLKMYQILNEEETEVLIQQMKKYQKSYSFLKKHMYSLPRKVVFGILGV